MQRSNFKYRFTATFLSALILSLIFLASCQKEPSVFTDKDTDTALSELGIIDSQEDDESDITLEVGDSAASVMTFSDAVSKDDIRVVSSNPYAVSVTLLATESGKAVVGLSAQTFGKSTVTLERVSLDGETSSLSELSVTVKKPKIYHAEFSFDTEAGAVLCEGKEYSGILAVYSTGRVNAEDVSISSSDSAVVDIQKGVASFSEFTSYIPFNVASLHTGTAEISATFGDGSVFTEVVSVTNEAIDEAEKESEQGTDYILNTSSKKFHSPTCRGARDMKEENKESFYGKRSELLSLGYSPCGICMP